MTDNEKVNCNASETGQCALHNVEIERRRNSDKTIDSLKVEFKTFESNIESNIDIVFSKISKINAFVAQVKVIGLIALSIWAASFIYTRWCYTTNSNQINLIKKEISSIERRVDKTESNDQVNNEKFIRLIDRIDTTNKRLSELVEKLEKYK